MRVFIIVLALAYWGVVMLAQSYLSRSDGAPAVEAQELSLRETP